MKFDEDFKKAVKAMPEHEKDKLLLRLLKQNPTLANRLYFELVDESTVDSKREKMEARIVSGVERALSTYQSPNYLMMDLRFLSGDISEHVKVTRDKFGEVYLNLRMLVLALAGASSKLHRETPDRSSRLFVYMIAKVFNMLVLMQKFHPDIQYDLKQDLREIGKLIGDNHSMMRTSMYHGLDVNWLITGDIPDNIAQLQKDLRQRGYLK